MSFSVALPRLMRVGFSASAELSESLKTLGLSRPFIVSDRFLHETGRVDALVNGLATAGISAGIFVDTVPEPTVASIDAAVEALKAGDFDCVVGFGGGSPIDSAKAAAVLAVHGGIMRDYKTPHIQDEPGLPVLAVPTTAGTGSEATRFTIITDEASDEKMLCSGLAYLPVAAIIDFELTLTKPPRLTADTGIDALTHAIEAYVSTRATPFSDIFAIAAMQAIGPNLRKVWQDPQNRAAREAMMLGATYAGIAFSNSSVALVHGMSRPIGAHFHVPHGLSNAMLLPLVTAFSAPAAIGRYAACARAIGVSDDSVGDQASAAALVEELHQLNRDLGVPSPRLFGIEESRWSELLPTMVEQAIASGSPGNNPKLASPDEMARLYLAAWF